ncbi:MAG: alpha/beta hydrolase [Candidatus Woesearchaeota archaeon]
MELDVVFRNEKREKLVGVLSYPLGRETCPSVILCHGFAADKESHFLPALSEALVKEGIAVLRFDCRACGRSEGDEHPTYRTMVEDVKAALSFLRGQERITSVGLGGHSMGGTSVIMAASQDGDVGAVVSFGAVADPHRSAKAKREDFVEDGDGYSLKVGSRTFRFSEAWFTDASKVKPLEAVRSLSASLLVVHGTADDRVPLDDGKDLFLKSKLPKSLKMIDGAGHMFKGFEDQLVRSSVSFFCSWLKMEKEE